MVSRDRRHRVQLVYDNSKCGCGRYLVTVIDRCFFVPQRRLALEKSSRVEEKEPVGPDYDTYVYSATMDVDILEWWVNWAEFRKNGEVFFHMGLLDGERFRVKDALRTMRRDVRNILNWVLECSTLSPMD